MGLNHSEEKINYLQFFNFLDHIFPKLIYKSSNVQIFSNYLQFIYTIIHF